MQRINKKIAKILLFKQRDIQASNDRADIDCDAFISDVSRSTHSNEQNMKELSEEMKQNTGLIHMNSILQ